MHSTPIATLGTPTTHGGMVTSATSGLIVSTRPVARLGDSVSCPLHGPGVIIDGAHSVVDGRPLARHGSSTSCGASLIVTSSGPSV
ncbi:MULTISPECIES: PAAR domain-containing protein [unclassified Caballeronia]|uniref:PAAR domain-containing protein n=1 Tax=unclassified Caballeronia TaxID=2646786 RepID=UPI002866213F|nr:MULTISPECIES: PAAR domain-containing protein [unclassified Caballeronia]MDR5818667.1 PAAR domain-containing protein [Caballeronia sp. LZ033]MDR5884071.1 PAAR domain-containing protein [Caballeronia sp. LZ032]